MKRFLTLLLSVLCASFALAQTPAEILAKMDQEVSLHEAEGVSMVFEFKVPIVGTISSQIWTKGEKARMEFKAASEQMVTWMDETTQWTYNSSNGEVTIENGNPLPSPKGTWACSRGWPRGMISR
jgi:outer membrane lipoprotein-sorting protein